MKNKMGVINAVMPGDFVKGERDGQIGLVIQTGEAGVILIVQYPSGEWGSIRDEYITEARRLHEKCRKFYQFYLPKHFNEAWERSYTIWPENKRTKTVSCSNCNEPHALPLEFNGTIICESCDEFLKEDT